MNIAARRQACEVCRVQTPCLLDCYGCDRPVCIPCQPRGMPDDVVFCPECWAHQQRNCQANWCTRDVEQPFLCAFCRYEIRRCPDHKLACRNRICRKLVCREHIWCIEHAPQCGTCARQDLRVVPCRTRGCEKVECAECRDPRWSRICLDHVSTDAVDYCNICSVRALKGSLLQRPAVFRGYICPAHWKNLLYALRHLLFRVHVNPRTQERILRRRWPADVVKMVMAHALKRVPIESLRSRTLGDGTSSDGNPK